MGIAALPMFAAGAFWPKIAMLGVGMALNYATRDRKKKTSDKSNDLKVSSSTYGRGIPIVYGTVRATGNMIWSTDLEEVRRYVGPKGKEKTAKKADKGKAEEVIEYYGNFAMAFCEGPKEDIIRMWADSNLIYDKYDPGEAVRPGFSQEEEDSGGKTGLTGDKKGRSANSGRWPYRFYGGSEDQMPDPYMERFHPGKTPAYRGMCYIFFERFPLLDFGNRIPTITVEVVPRKVRTMSWVEFTPLVDPEIPIGNYSGYTTYIDPTRNRLYQGIDVIKPFLQRVPTMRVWDTKTHMELTRWEAPVGETYIGLTGSNGMMTQEVQNDSRVTIIRDPYTGVEVARAGRYGIGNFFAYRQPEDGPGYVLGIPALWSCAPLFGAVDPLTAAPEMATAMQSFFAQGGMWWHGNGMDNFATDVWSNSAPIYTWLSPGIKQGCFSGAPGTGEFFTIFGSVVYKSLGATFAPPSGPDVGDFYYESRSSSHSTFFIAPSVQGYQCLVEPPIWILGAELYLILYRPQKSSPVNWFAAGVKPNGEVVYNVFIGALNEVYNLTENNWQYQPVPFVFGTDFSFMSRDRIITIDGRDGSTTIMDLDGTAPSVTGAQYWLDTMGAILLWGAPGRDMPGYNGINRWYLFYIDRYQQEPANLSEILYDLAARAGISADMIDMSGLRDDTVAGFIIEQPMPARDAVEQLMQLYFFDATESDWLLKFRTRGNASIATIPEKWLASAGEGGDRYIESRVQEIDLPRVVTVSFIDSENDYLNGTAHYRRPRSAFTTMQSSETFDLSFPMVMTPQGGKKACETILFGAWKERAGHQFALPWSYLYLDPTDVIKVQMDDGLTLNGRITQTDIGSNLTMELETVQEAPAQYTNVISTEYTTYPVPAYDPDTGWAIDLETGGIIDPISGNIIDPSSGEVIPPYVPPGYPPLIPEDLVDIYNPITDGAPGGAIVPLPTPAAPVVAPVLMDTPYTDDADATTVAAEFPLYWGAATDLPGLTAATLMVSVPPADYISEGTTTRELIHGICQNALPPPPNGDFATDDSTVITVVQAYDYEARFVYDWESIADVDWPSYRNMILIGDEIILFKTAEVVGNGTVLLSTLIRGHRGTEQFAYNHVPGERAIIMNTDGHQQVFIASQALDQLILGKANSFAFLQSLAPHDSLVYRANALRPYAPNHIARDDTGSDSSITWERRTRYNGPLRNGAGTVPLNENSLEYRLFILTAEPNMATFDPFTTNARMVELTTNQYTYTSAMKTADGIGATDTFWAIVYQMSATVQYGFPGVAQLETDIATYKVV